MTMTCIPVRGKTLLRILRSPVIPQLLATSVPAPNKVNYSFPVQQEGIGLLLHFAASMYCSRSYCE